MYLPQNYVKTAVSKIGGPTRAAHAVGVSNATIHNWVKQQRISNIDKAKLMAQLAGMELQQLRSTL